MLALILLQAAEGPREKFIEEQWKRDSTQFFEVKDRFGRARIDPRIRLADGKHSIIHVPQAPDFVFERFLVGNKTDKFTGQAMRTTIVPLTRGQQNPKATFPVKDVELEVRRSFGTDFKWWTKGNKWVVYGYPLRAKAECLSCHTKAKEGDPLGYLVYAAGGVQAELR